MSRRPVDQGWEAVSGQGGGWRRSVVEEGGHPHGPEEAGGRLQGEVVIPRNHLEMAWQPGESRP